MSGPTKDNALRKQGEVGKAGSTDRSNATPLAAELQSASMEDTYAPYSIELINTALCGATIRKTLRNQSAAVVKTNELSRVLLPYSLVERKPGWLLPVNRIYKPVGLCDDGLCNTWPGPAWADYEDAKYQSLLLLKKNVDLSLLKQIHRGQWWFYTDDDSPFSRCSTPANRRKYHIKLWHAFRHWGIPLPNITPALLKSAEALGIDILAAEVGL